MGNKWKIALFAVGGLFALIILAAIALVLFVDVNALKPREGKDGRYAIRPATAARLVYSGPGGKVTADRIALGVDNLAVVGDGKDDILRRISFSGTAGAGEIRTENLVVTDLTTSVAGKGGVLDLDASTMRLFGGEGSGSFRADRKPEVDKVHYLQSVAGPVLKLFRQTRNLLGEKCEVAYKGSVAPTK
jgi:hypothetical protein